MLTRINLIEPNFTIEGKNLFPQSLYPFVWVYLFTTKHALDFSNMPFTFRLKCKIDLFPMALWLGGRSTKFQLWFYLIDFISSFITLIHNSLADNVIASLQVLGSSPSCKAIINASPSILKWQCGMGVQLFLWIKLSCGASLSCG